MMKAALYKATRPGAPGLYNRLVRWFERGPYSHCELIFSDGIAASASYMDKGVRFKTIEFNPANWDFIDLPDADEAAAYQWFLDHEDEPYDVWGNIRFCLGWIAPGEGKSFCSSAIAAAIGFADPWRYGPNILWSALNRSVSINQEIAA